MALFFTEHKGPIFAGSFLILTVLIGFFSNLLGGYLADRFKRKLVLIITSSTSATMFGFMTICLIPNPKWIILFAVFYLFYISSSSLGRPAMNAIIIDSTTAENRKDIYAVDYWLTNLSLALGTATGGLFYIDYQLTLFTALTLISTLLPIVYSIWLKDTSVDKLKKLHKNVFIDLALNYKVALQDKKFVLVVLGLMFIFAAELTLNSYIGVRLNAEFESFFLNNFEINGIRMLSLLNIQNMIIVVFATFLVTKITNNFSEKKMLLFGLILYSLGYTVITSANIWFVLLLFNFVATIGELIYSPIANAEKANMMPKNQRASYSAFAGISFSGAELIARFTIIIGAFLVPTMMSVYIGIVLMVGVLLLYVGLFYLNKKIKGPQM
jgi:MFS family permease